MRSSSKPAVTTSRCWRPRWLIRPKLSMDVQASRHTDILVRHPLAIPKVRLRLLLSLINDTSALDPKVCPFQILANPNIRSLNR